MAKPKKSIHLAVYKLAYRIHLWCDNPDTCLRDLSTIEGINSLLFNRQFIEIAVDPRYDIDEVAEEIEALLTVQVPPVFRED